MTLASGIKLMQCSCKNAYQDKKYGAQTRVHNAQGGKKVGQYRCTVCSTSRGG